MYGRVGASRCGGGDFRSLKCGDLHMPTLYDAIYIYIYIYIYHPLNPNPRLLTVTLRPFGFGVSDAGLWGFELCWGRAWGFAVLA